MRKNVKNNSLLKANFYTCLTTYIKKKKKKFKIVQGGQEISKIKYIIHKQKNYRFV